MPFVAPLPRPRLPLRCVLAVYGLLWRLGLPLVRLYLRNRGQRDPRYLDHWDERFQAGPGLPDAVWVHAVSIGEMRSAVPLIRALLDRGERVVTTHLTPAGRQAAHAAFGPEIAAGRVLVRYLPAEVRAVWTAFYARHRPKVWLVMEIEIWPIMIDEAARARVPLFLANSQVPGKSWPRARALGRWIGHPVSRVAGVLAKSDRHAERFRALGARDVQVAGELRFDQPVPPAQVTAGQTLRDALARPVVTLASVVAGEEALYLDAILQVQDRARGLGMPVPLFVWVPRAPELFDDSFAMLAAAGQRVMRRSKVLGTALDGDLPADTDILLGDSFGEMYFYLSLGDLAVVGGGFVPKGAHNVIEPLALRKPVLVGPHVWTIEYPGEEARAAGVLEICADAGALAARIDVLTRDAAARAALAVKADAFFATHAGAVARMMAALAPMLGDADD
ncbi:MAG: glycosyltransferase N-terminal domain-containing protein [Gemmobacter sp.]|nr:glycosyltransferase N-terminal domain-containing protein [Gemmobacter sp.]